nr:hybrid sensor histidine kinase/response regulator transcription factor [Pseudochryseolinea flava]
MQMMKMITLGYKHVKTSSNWALRLLIFFGCIFSMAYPSFAQEQSPTFHAVAPDVLSNSFVRCFYKDSRGFMWIATEDALIRYDGNYTYRYTHDVSDKNSIPHNTINCMAEDDEKQLWIGTAQGLSIYNRELDNFITVDSIKGNRNYLNNRYITDLEFDAKGMLWIGTHEGGINVYDPVKKAFTYLVDQPRSGRLPSSNFVNSLVNMDDKMWCSTKGGLLLYDTHSFKRLPLGSLEQFSNAQISAIVPEKKGSLLVSTVGGEIMRVTPGNGDYDVDKVLSGTMLGESANKILSLCVDANGNILAGGENSGFNIISHDGTRVRRLLAEEDNLKRLPSNYIQSIYVDNSGTIWIGTFNNGAFLLENNAKKFNTSSINNFPRLANEVRSFAEDDQGNLWLALNGIGIAQMNPVQQRVQLMDKINRKISNKNITSIICDRFGALWLGTAGKGIFKVNLKTFEVTNYSLTSEGFGNDQVFCVYENRKGVVWAGTWGSGLFYFDSQRHQFVSATEYKKVNHIPNTAYVSDMMEDSKGTFWVGTLYGLYELTPDVTNSFSYRLHLPDATDTTIIGAQIQVVVEDKNKDLWVGTTEALNVRRHGTSDFIRYPLQRNGLANTVRSILPDNHGNVWLGASNGLLKFDAKTKTFINYTREDGLKSTNFNRKACLATRAGNFLFGGNRGIDSFFPDSIRTTPTQAALMLCDLKINNRSIKPGDIDSPLKKHISLTSDVTLAYDQRSFVIDFVALDLALSPDYNYCYMLKGFDKDWNCIGSNHSAIYTNIDPGTYEFMVKASNKDGVWLSESLRLEITIRPVFWKTWWAFSVYLIVLTLFVYFVARVRIERLKLKNEIKFEKLKREQEHALSESKTQFFTNVAHEFRTPLSLILIPLESLMGTNDVPGVLRDRIYTAFKNASRMRRLVNELLDFNKLEVGNIKLNVQHGDVVKFIVETSAAFNEMAAKRGISFSLSADSNEVRGWFDRDKLERVIFNVLSNAFKFTADGGAIKLTIQVKHAVIPNGMLCQCIELVIEDNGIGILQEELPHIFEKFYQAKSSFKAADPGTGIGLSLAKALVELHHGTISAESVPDKATVFKILLPIDGKLYQVSDDTLAPADVQREAYHFDFVNAPSSISEIAHDESTKPRVLIVEDNLELRAYLAAELRVAFAVLEANNGEEGLAITLAESPDLIVSDVMMPVRNGIEFCQAVKSDLSTCHIPFVLLSAKATIEDQIAGINTGADLYIPKPFNIRHLMAHVSQMVSSRQRLYARFSQDVYLMPGKVATNALDQEFLQKAIDYIISNLQDSQLSVDSIASLFNLSRMHVYRKIKALTGKSVVEFIRMVRMKQAIKLMDSHKLTLSEIAFEVGFNSASYFSRTFKEEYGRTPSEYLQEK